MSFPYTKAFLHKKWTSTIRIVPGKAILLLLVFAVPASVTGQNWPQISFSKPISGFKHPTHLASARDGTGRLFGVEQESRIRIIKNGSVLVTPFLDITPRVGGTAGTKGLLSVAFPPDYATKQRFYVNHTTSAGNLVVSRYQVSFNPDVADATTEQGVFTDGPFPGQFGGE